MRLRTAAAAILMLPATGCGSADRCSEQLVETLAAPGGSGIAAFRVVRNCAAAEPAATVKIGREFDGPDRADLVFAADSDHGSAPGSANGVRLTMQWQGPKQLTVTYARGARAMRAEPEARGVTLRYRPEAPAS